MILRFLSQIKQKKQYKLFSLMIFRVDMIYLR